LSSARPFRLGTRFQFSTANIAATLQTLRGASFVVDGATQALDAAPTQGSGRDEMDHGWSATGIFEGEFSEVTCSYAGMGVVRYAW
jgi:hypothetical protein